MRRNICCLTVILFLAALFYSPLPVRAAKQANYSLGHQAAVLYNNESGLPTSEANAIAQTSDGFIWIGGYRGLTRYDGVRFENFDTVEAVPSAIALFVDSKDRLWIGTNDSGLACYENESCDTSYSESEALLSRSIHAICEDGKGRIVLGTTMGMGYVDEDNTLKFLDSAQLKTEYVDELHADADGLVYGRTLSGAIFTLDDELQVRSFYTPDNSDLGEISCITPDPSKPGSVLLGTTHNTIVRATLEDGIHVTKTWSTGSMNDLNAIMPTGDEIYICTDEGIGYIDKDGLFHTMDGLPMNNSVDSVMRDFEGNLWFTSSRQGVMKIVPNDFLDLTGLAGYPDVVVNATCKFHDRLYIGSDNGLIILDENAAPVNNKLTKMLRDVRIRCIREDGRGNLCLATYSQYGLVTVDPKGNITPFGPEQGMTSERVRTFLHCSNGDIVAATSGGGVNMIRDNQVYTVLDAGSGITNPEILCLAEKSDGTLLMGSDGDGIYEYKNGNTKQYNRKNGLSSEVVMRIVPDPATEDAFWIVTGTRLDYMKPDGTIHTIDKFTYADNFDICFDSADNVWVLSGTGIYVGPRKSFFDDGELDVSFYDVSCGLPTMPTANSYSYMEGGDFYIAGSSGVVSVDTASIMNDEDSPMLTIPYVEADGKKLPVGEDNTIWLDADTTRLTIRASAITYSMNNSKVRYSLSGFEDDYTTLTRRELEPPTYTNLKGGTYTFVLESLSPTTGEVQESTSIIINKTRAFYENPLFWVFTMALFAALLLFIAWIHFREETKALEERQRRQTAFINQTINAFAKAIDYKDRYTNGHSFRVAEYTMRIANRLGYDPDQVENIYNIALLHDIGKLAIPDEILNKPSALNDEEYEVMKTHASIGQDILKEIVSSPELSQGAGFHHERIDGKGYPNGLKGDEIPEVAQIIAVADTFDAMYSTRPYRKKLELSTVLDELRRISGTQLNPKFVEVFIQICEDGEVK